MKGVCLFALALAVTASVFGQQPTFTSIDRDGNVSWSSSTGVLYQLQKTLTLPGQSWTNVSGVVIGTGAEVTVQDTNRNTSQAFYRVVVTETFSCTNSGGASCASATYLGQVNGDTSAGGGFPPCQLHPCYPVPTRSGCGNAWFQILLYEDSNCVAYLQLNVRLEVPAGADYDLYLYRQACASQPLASTNGPGQTENLVATVNDSGTGSDDSTYFLIEVRQLSGGSSGNWTLRMSGGNGPCY